MKAKGFAHLGAILLFTLPPASQASTIDELLITEVMANPASVSDGLGEWFELYNSGDSVIDLDGLILHDDGSNQYHFDAPLPIGPGDIGTPGAPGNTRLTPSTLPAASWLFISAILTLLGLDYHSQNRATPAVCTQA